MSAFGQDLVHLRLSSARSSETLFLVFEQDRRQLDRAAAHDAGAFLKVRFSATRVTFS